MLRTLSKILDILTMAVGALGSISLLVGGVGIVTIMTIAVTERTGEIGLLVALGAPRRTILGLFLGEAVALGTRRPDGPGLGIGLAQLIHLALPALPVHTPLSFVLLAEAVAIIIGLAAGVLPARRAARLDPVEALRAEWWQTIHLYRDAPPKPAVGAPCNGCGVCCAAAPCPASLLIFSRRREPCPCTCVAP